MKSFSSPNNSWKARILWCGAVASATVALGFSVIEVLSLSSTPSRAAVVVASVFVSLLVGRYETRIPGTRITFSPKDIFGFWGVIWLGVSGGVLLGACASLVSHRASFADRKRLMANVAVDTLATFIAAIAFYLSLGYMGTVNRIVLGGLSIPGEIVLASCVMALTHFSHRYALGYLVTNIDQTSGSQIDFRKILLVPFITTLLSLVATVFLFVIFNHFGIEFGLVIIPLAVVGHLSYKIHVTRLDQKTKLISEASRIHLATVEALATAIDARDQVGMGHVRRTQIYAVGIGNILGLAEDEINALRTGALLHDIGKLAVPDHILNKPGRLTPAEMEKTKTHSLVGASILEKVGFPYPVVPTVKYHHEYWDGMGYPEGLRGGSIPLTARILAIADAYDTLRGARPYRPAIPRDEACNFLRSRAGSQFDPTLVDVFLRNLKIFENEISVQHLTYESDREAVNVSTVVDVGASPNYVEQIKRANREAFTLYSLARDFSSALELDEILSLFSEKVRELVPFDTSVVYLLDEDTNFARAAYVEGKNKSAFEDKRIKVGEGATGYVLKMRRAAENVDPALDFELSNAELKHEYLAMASIPLMADEKLVGAISLYSAEMPSYQDEHLRLLETISHIAADAICKS